MEIILQENYPALGYVGDKVKVRDGYARNYLIPRGIAVEASNRSERLLNHRLSGILAKKAKLKADAEEYSKNLMGLTLEYVLKVGEKGKTFGSVTTRDIEADLLKRNIQVERKQLRLHEAVKAPGEYKVDVRLHSEVVVQVTVKVSAEKSAKTEHAEGEGRRRRSRRGKDAEGAAEGAGEQNAEAEDAENAETAERKDS